MFKVRMCVPINEIESGNWDEIELLTSPPEIEWQLCVVKLNEFLFKLNEINSKRNDIKRNWRLKEWKWTMRAESWQKSREYERLFMIFNAILMKLGGEAYRGVLSVFVLFVCVCACVYIHIAALCEDVIAEYLVIISLHLYLYTIRGRLGDWPRQVVNVLHTSLINPH